MNHDLFTALYCVTSFFAGGTALALIYERKLKQGRAVIEELSGRLHKAELSAKWSRRMANDMADDLRKLRNQLPQRDPVTRRFVRRRSQADTVANG